MSLTSVECYSNAITMKKCYHLKKQILLLLNSCVVARDERLSLIQKIKSSDLTQLKLLGKFCESMSHKNHDFVIVFLIRLNLFYLD